MKKIVALLSVLFFSYSFALAETTTEEILPDQNEQLVEVEEAGALLLFQKQPIYNKQIQVIRVKKSGAITVLQINGKPIEVKENKDITE